MISVFDIFRIGIGPSSSHTVGPMRAAATFAAELAALPDLNTVDRVLVDVYGSLSLTGIGHGTHTAILAGLMGEMPDTVDPDRLPSLAQMIRERRGITINEAGGRLSQAVAFDIDRDLVFHKTFLSRHENGLTCTAFCGKDPVLSRTYYSIGGGAVVEDSRWDEQKQDSCASVPYPYRHAADLLSHCERTGLPLSSVMMQNECALRPREEVEAYLLRLWKTMDATMERGMHSEGLLPGPLRVVRRASSLRRLLQADQKLSADPMQVIDWVNMFAFAVSEENAASGRVVTAPTNGSCGTLPAVLAYYRKFVGTLTDETIERFLLTAGAIGSLYRMNASISGAEVGCQGEVGVACSMAAAALTEILGGSAEQVCSAAEIAMEHNLGLTCDPVNGQVQVPCIERNAVAAVKAINASRLAMHRTTTPRVSLDKVIETMYLTGKDMNLKYRETARGGLAAVIFRQKCD
jgi:L-serine dehydratase